MPRKKQPSVTIPFAWPGSMSVQNTEFLTTAFGNTYEYNAYLLRLIDIACASIEWLGLPETIDARTLELTLLGSARALVFEDEIVGPLALPFNMYGGNFDVYGVPIKREAYSRFNNYRVERTNKNSVIIYNNYTRTATLPMLCRYAECLQFIDAIIGINVNAQKTPVLIRASQDEMLTMKNLYMKYDGNQPFIFGTKSLPTQQFGVLKTDAPFLSLDLYSLKQKYWNEALTFIGVPNVEEKKERRIQYEVNQGSGGITASGFSRVAERQAGVKKLQTMFPSWAGDIEVRYRDLSTIETAMPDAGQPGEGVPENE